jgi:hypothetical protein
MVELSIKYVYIVAASADDKRAMAPKEDLGFVAVCSDMQESEISPVRPLNIHVLSTSEPALPRALIALGRGTRHKAVLPLWHA